MTNFQPRTGAKVYDSSGAAMLLDQEIGKGGEGSVWSIKNDPQVVAKFYYSGLPPERIRKLEAMCKLKSESLLRIAAWPTGMLKSSPSGSAEGLAMRRITGYEAAHLLYSPKSRRTAFPEAQFPFILHTTANIARSFAAIHDSGQVIGDVNHGNLLVARNATVALIDCDSFEITDGHTTFPCLVGVPEYTPPELQGHIFQGIHRTRQHDAFGLAVLIFHMLFLGRDPFAGIPNNGISDVTIPEAIREYRFAYLPDHNATRMEPPVSAPRLSEFSPTISQFFIRAFTRDGMNSGRPSAHDWIAALESFSKSIIQCTANSSHHFYKALPSCPWCRIEAMVGIPLFGIKTIIVRGEKFDIASVWAQIEAIHAVVDSLPPPTSQTFFDNCSVDPKIEASLKRRRARRLMSSGFILVAVIVVAAGQLPFVASIAVLLCGLYGTRRLWASGNVIGTEFKLAFDTALENYNTSIEDWTKANQPPVAFLQTKKALEAAKQEFNDLPALRARKLAELNGNRWPKQLQYFLERYRIEDIHIPGIGPGRKTLLRSYNIEDAYDVEYHKLESVKGFGPAMRAILLDWRKGLEREFQFDPNQPVDPIDLQRLEQEFNHKKADLIRSLKGGPQELQRSLLLWQAQRSQLRSRLEDSALRLAQAQVIMNALTGRFAAPAIPVPASVPPVSLAPSVAASVPLPTLLRPPSPKPTWRWGVMIAALIILIGVFAFRALKQDGHSMQAPNVHTDSIQVGHYRFNTSSTGSGSGFIEIFADGKLEKRITGGSFSIPKSSEELPGWHNGSDINGDSIPEVITPEFSGGAHCCTTWHIFSAGPTLREIPTPKGVGGDDPRVPLVDVNHNGHYELRIVDSTFDYLNTSYAHPPAITLFYVWRAGRYAFAPELVRRPHFSREELQKMAQKLSWHNTSQLPDKEHAEFYEVPREFWADLLHLVETGNADQVDVFSQIAWPGTKAGKARFLATFRKQLRNSPHLAEFERLNAIRPSIRDRNVGRTVTATAKIFSAPPQIDLGDYADPLAKTLPVSGGPGTSGFGTGTGGRIYRAGHDVAMPRLISKVEPEYSEKAYQANLSGTVLLSIVIDKQGLPRDIRVTRALGLGLDEKAVQAVSRWRFSPGLKGGQPVPVRADIEVSFRLCKDVSCSE